MQCTQGAGVRGGRGRPRNRAIANATRSAESARQRSLVARQTEGCSGGGFRAVAVRGRRRLGAVLCPSGHRGLEDSGAALPEALEGEPSEQMAQIEATGIQDAYRDVRYKLREDKENKHNKLLRGDAVISEFRHMLQQGYEFVDKNFGEEVQAYITSIDEHTEAKAKRLDVAFVRVFEKFGEQTFQVVKMHGLHNMSRPPIDDAVEYTSETLPADLMGKLSNLNMLQKGGYVEDVGFNSGDGLFYVTL